MLTLREEKIIDQENVIGRNIRHLRLQKSMGQTELIKQLKLKNIARHVRDLKIQGILYLMDMVFRLRRKQ